MKVLKNILETSKKVKGNRKRLINLFERVYNLFKQGQGLNTVKILTPQQMFTRLPILLPQIQASNKSQKLKNEARQLSYPLYKSKMISKIIYNTLIRRI